MDIGSRKLEDILEEDPFGKVFYDKNGIDILVRKITKYKKLYKVEISIGGSGIENIKRIMILYSELFCQLFCFTLSLNPKNCRIEENPIEQVKTDLDNAIRKGVGFNIYIDGISEEGVRRRTEYVLRKIYSLLSIINKRTELLYQNPRPEFLVLLKYNNVF